MHRNVTFTLAALALAACSPDFDPASKVDKLRVLAIKAEPPEVEPGSVATLESLVLRADFDADPLRTTTVVSCTTISGGPPVHAMTATEPIINDQPVRAFVTASHSDTGCTAPSDANRARIPPCAVDRVSGTR